MKKHNIIIRLFNLASRWISFIGFKLRFPEVKFINPIKIGTFYSQDGQDLYLASLLFNAINQNDKLWVVDVGCNHPRHFSNSLFFEKYFGCQVLAIDPLEEFRALWKQERPKSIFISSAIGNSVEPITLRVPHGTDGDNMFFNVAGGVNKATNLEFSERTVQCVKLESVLSNHQINDVLLMSIDVEGFELEVLKSIDFEKVIVRCICLENNSTNLYGSDDVRDFLKLKGYVFLARIGYLDDVFVHGSMINGIPNVILLSDLKINPGRAAQACVRGQPSGSTFAQALRHSFRFNVHIIRNLSN
jgi:FkbM family methyltransferase